MTEQRQATKIVLVAVLGIALAFILMLRMGVFGSHKGTSSSPAQGSKAGPAAPGDVKNGASSADVQVPWKRPEPIGPTVSDPMHMDQAAMKPEKAETAAPATVQPKWVVAGIIYNTQQPSSIIIDGRILHEGDTIYEAKITQITESFAVLQKGGKTWKIYAGQANEEPK